MTFSVLARCERTGETGIAIATAMHAAGKLATYVQAGAGAIATQANLNPYLGIDGLRLLAQNRSAQETLDTLLSQDPDPEARQLGVMDSGGETAAWNGKNIFDWAGDASGRFFSTHGNRLVGPQVLEAIVNSMESTLNQDLVERLLQALEAGVAVGGDREGERSGNILIMSREEYPLWDLRVDDHENPVAELRRLFHLFAEELLPQIKKMPTRKEFPKVG